MTATDTPRICASPTCDRPVARPSRTGRPPIYCSRECRPAPRRAVPRSRVVVEVDHPQTSPDGRPPDRVWTVQLRRDNTIVIIADNLGWPSANALARQLTNLLNPDPQHTGAAID
jgi:hypothetical protein